MSITKLEFRDGHIPESLTWSTMVLISKSRGGYRGIEIVEVIWKVCALIVNNKLRNAINLKDTLNGFIKGRGVGTAIMEAKLVQQLAEIVHEPILQVFIDMRKAYDSLDRGRCMEIIRGYGLGPKLQRLIHRLWDKQEVVSKSGKFFGSLFRTERGVTQGDPVSPTIFNIVVDVVVREVLLKSCGPQKSHHGFVWLRGKHNICFHADDGQIAGHNLIWVQTTLTEMVRMFKRVVLQTFLRKNKAMVCLPGFVGPNREQRHTRGEQW